jgi:beta-glucosidase
VAELLFGEASPSGKLPVTFYRNEALEELPAFTDYSMRGRTYKNYTGEPLYPFGYGLSYADISLGGLRADRTRAVVSAANHSAFSAEEVVEVYVRDMGSPDAPVNPVLGGFARVRLEAGETEELAIPLDPRAFTVVGDDGGRRPGIGPWFVYAGFGQPDPITEKLTGRSCLRTEIVPQAD